MTDMTRYRAAWESARRRACRLRDSRDKYVHIVAEVHTAIAEVGIEWDTRGQIPADLVDAITGHIRPMLAQLAEHREAIEYALRHTLTEWRDATGRAEGTAAGALHRALDWITGMTPVHDPATEITGLALEMEECRGATARVEARQDAMDRRLDQLARRLDDVETTVNRTYGDDTPQTRIAYQVEIAETLTTAGLGPTVARQIASRLQKRFEIRQRPRPAEDGES